MGRMRVVAKDGTVRLDDDPKPKERVMWQRLRVLVEEEACHRDWGCALYRLHRTGRINNEQREAGDRYVALIRDWRKLWLDPMGQIEVYRSPKHEHLEKRGALTADVELMLGHAAALQGESEFETRRAKRLGQRYRDAMAIVGRANSILEAMLIDDIWPAGEREHLEIAYALMRLAYFFNTGTKHKRSSGQSVL